MEKCVLFLLPDRLVSYRSYDGRGNSQGNGQGNGQSSGADHGYAVDKEWKIIGDKLPSQFRLYLQCNLHAQYSIVFDLPEEECHQEELKITGYRDRRHVVERLKRKRFENSLFSKASISGTGGDRFLLLSGVDRNVLCESLLAELESVGVSLRSIHSSTLLTPEIGKSVLAKNSDLLFIVPLHGFFRLVACSGSSVLFTRQVAATATLDVNSSIELYHALNQSVEETLLYVKRLQASWSPSIVFVGKEAIANKLKSLRSSLPTVSEDAEIKSCCSSIGPAIKNTAAEIMLIHTSVKAGKGYAQKAHRIVYIGRRVRSFCAALALCGLTGVATSTAVANKLHSAHEVVADSYSQSNTILADDIAHLESLYDQPVEAVRQALVTARLLELSSQEPLEFLQILALNVHRQPDISISSVRWEADDIIDETLLVTLQEPPETLESVSLEQIYRVSLAGVVKGTSDTAFDQFESFVSVLRDATNNPSVVVVEAPFGLGEKRRTTGREFRADQGEFVLEVSNEKVER